MSSEAGVGPKKFASMRDFYPFYLSEHANRTSRRLHFAGTSLALAWLAAALATQNAWFLRGKIRF